jgi:hypothetical protein
MIRTILSPGVELNEVDKSQYIPNVGAVPRALIMGYASQGPNKTTTDVTSMTDFRTIYGTPTNEVERYFYNAVDQLMGTGATVVAAKIPYSSQTNYIGVQYTVGTTPTDRSIDVDLDELIERTAGDGGISSVTTISGTTPAETDISAVKKAIKKTDPTIASFYDLKASNVVKITDEAFLDLDSGARRDEIGTSGTNAFIIVDKTKSSYRTFTGNGASIDCLGILPVVTTAANAMAIAYEISGVNMDSVDSKEISATVNSLEAINGIDYISGTSLANAIATDKDISAFWSTYANTVANSNTLGSISKTAAEFFPPVVYSSSTAANAIINDSATTDGNVPFDHRYFSYIGIVVFKVGIDRANGCLIAEPVEAFAGSLLSEARDVRTNASTFIENIVNTTSNYISIFVGEALADQNATGTNNIPLLNEKSMLFARPAPGLILGLPPSAIAKTIDAQTINTCIDDITKSQSNILASTLDIVVDAGLSTIAECVKGRKAKNADGTENTDTSTKPLDVKELPLIKGDTGTHTGPWTEWRSIVNKYKKFCQQTRKDCAFVVDSPRFLTLRNQRKIVNPNDMGSSVAKLILPKIKLISGINTSYGWGYTTWFNIGCASDGTSFWCPPSIFGAAAYINTRTRWHTWDAPAGLTRGVVSVDDTSFEPDLNARNVIYSNGWNYALTDVQNNVVTLEGQKTFQSYPSAFDRINVRSLFLDLERRVFKIARNYIYEPNTADTRQQFVDNITPIFETTMSEGGCYDYRIIADESLNTPEVIDNNEFRIRIGVQPTKTIEFILMEFVAARTGSDWSELVPE